MAAHAEHTACNSSATSPARRKNIFGPQIAPAGRCFAPSPGRVAGLLCRFAESFQKPSEPPENIAKPFPKFSSLSGKVAKPSGNIAEPLGKVAKRIGNIAKPLRNIADAFRQFPERVRKFPVRF